MTTHLIAKLADSVRNITLVHVEHSKLITLLPPTSSRLRRCVVTDSETFGLELEDPVVEIAAREVFIDEVTGAVWDGVEGVTVFEGRQDPGMPVPADITELTGLTDADLAGQEMEWYRLAVMLARADFVIAHNAGFDCPRIQAAVKRHAPGAWHRAIATRRGRPLIWACTQSQIDWHARGAHRNLNLEALSWQHGFWFDPHRAMSDVEAVVELLKRSGAGAELLRRASLPVWRITALQTPFPKKSRLKGRRYYWDPEMRGWFMTVESEGAVEDELNWLAAHIYANDPERIPPREWVERRTIVACIEPQDRFLP